MASRAYAERQAGREERNKARCPITDTASRPLRGLAISLASATGPSKLCQHPNPIYFLFQSSSCRSCAVLYAPESGLHFQRAILTEQGFNMLGWRACRRRRIEVESLGGGAKGMLSAVGFSVRLLLPVRAFVSWFLSIVRLQVVRASFSVLHVSSRSSPRVRRIIPYYL